MKGNILFRLIFLNLLNMMFAMQNELPLRTISTKLATSEDVRQLYGTRAEDVLPLVLIQPASLKTLHPPETMEVLQMKDGRMTSGSEFYKNQRDRQIFFCGTKDPTDKCLLPQRFKEEQPLRCNVVPKPSITAPDLPCGRRGIGKTREFVYKLCEAPKGYDYETQELVIFKFCYFDDIQKTLYTEYEILSPQILDEQVMIRERQVEFDISAGNHGIEILNYSAHSKSPRGHKAVIDIGPFPYFVQELVSPDNMAFALWKKPTAHRLNGEFQHRDLMDLWDEINNSIRFEATKMYYNIPYKIYTGVFEICEVIPEDQFANIWVQMVTATYKTGRRTGIAIIMDNFIIKKGTDDQATPVDDKKQTESKDGQTPTSDDKKSKPKKRFCDDDLCDESLKEKFAEVGGQINCCPINDKVQELFGTALRIDGLLRITDVIRTL